MIGLLISIIGLLIALIIYLNFQFFKQKRAFKIKIMALQEVIVEITKTQIGKQEQLQLSEELEKKMKSNRSVLNEAIFGLHYELFDLLSKNKLLK